jgi:hypothetical protein
MQKIQISFDAKQLNKSLMNEGYVSLDIIPLKEAKVKTRKDGTPITGDGWRLMKTHFVVQACKDKDVKMPIIGDGTVFEKVEAQTESQEVDYPEADNDIEIPF